MKSKKLFKNLKVVATTTLFSTGFFFSAFAQAAGNCNGSDCIAYNINTQDTCKAVKERPTYDSRWAAGLSQDVDNTIKKGNIIAYKIQWFNGRWSGWYVPGVNDIDWKFNRGSNNLRRSWAYFYDHNHYYIICSKTPGAF